MKYLHAVLEKINFLLLWFINHEGINCACLPAIFGFSLYSLGSLDFLRIRRTRNQSAFVEFVGSFLILSLGKQLFVGLSFDGTVFFACRVVACMGSLLLLCLWIGFRKLAKFQHQNATFNKIFGTTQLKERPFPFTTVNFFIHFYIHHLAETFFLRHQLIFAFLVGGKSSVAFFETKRIIEVDYLLLILPGFLINFESVCKGTIFLESVDQSRCRCDVSNRYVTVTPERLNGDLIHDKTETSYNYIIVFILTEII